MRGKNRGLLVISTLAEAGRIERGLSSLFICSCEGGFTVQQRRLFTFQS